MEKVKKVTRKKLNIKRLIILLLIIYLIVMLFYTFFTMPIKNIYIKNTNILTDNEIIEVANIKDYPSFFTINTKKIERNIKSLEIVDDVSVSKKINGKLVIEVTEAKPLFYNRNINKVILSNHLEVNNNAKYLGIPTLINYVPTDLLTKFIDTFKNIDSDIIAMINEIEYNPDISEEITIDDNRFLLRMNDSNQVYVNVINMKRLNDYKEIMMTIEDKRGTIYLDSYNTGNILFTEYTNEKEIIEEVTDGEN